MRIAVTCPCGKDFEVYPSRAERSKYCSKTCKYEHQTRPSGLRYEIKVENSAWIKPGQRLSPETEFKPGLVPWNFKGDEVGYQALHDWVRRWKGAPMACEHCGRTDGRLHWANKSHDYLRELDDWFPLCPKCHKAYDADHKGASRKVYERCA